MNAKFWDYTAWGLVLFGLALGDHLACERRAADAGGAAGCSVSSGRVPAGVERPRPVVGGGGDLRVHRGTSGGGNDR